MHAADEFSSLIIYKLSLNFGICGFSFFSFFPLHADHLGAFGCCLYCMAESESDMDNRDTDSDYSHRGTEPNEEDEPDLSSDEYVFLFVLLWM